MDQITSLKRHEMIKMELRLRGSSMAAVARQLGVSQSAVALVSKGTMKSQRIADALASAIGQN